MASVNKIILVGNCGRDPEVRTFPSGDQVCNVTIATTDKWKDKQSGDIREHTEWHRLSFNGRLAEIAGQYLRKGSQVYVEGSLRSRKYNDKDGVERTVTEVRADVLQLLGNKEGGGEPTAKQAPPQRQQPARQPPAQPQRQSSGFEDMDDDIPF